MSELIKIYSSWIRFFVLILLPLSVFPLISLVLNNFVKQESKVFKVGLYFPQEAEKWTNLAFIMDLPLDIEAVTIKDKQKALADIEKGVLDALVVAPEGQPDSILAKLGKLTIELYYTSKKNVDIKDKVKKQYEQFNEPLRKDRLQKLNIQEFMLYPTELKTNDLNPIKEELSNANKKIIFGTGTILMYLLFCSMLLSAWLVRKMDYSNHLKVFAVTLTGVCIYLGWVLSPLLYNDAVKSWANLLKNFVRLENLGFNILLLPFIAYFLVALYQGLGGKTRWWWLLTLLGFFAFLAQIKLGVLTCLIPILNCFSFANYTLEQGFNFLFYVLIILSLSGLGYLLNKRKID